jgi:hypothetical protein
MVPPPMYIICVLCSPPRIGGVVAVEMVIFCLRADRGGGPGLFGFFSGVAGFINFFDHTPISDFEFQRLISNSFCLKFLLLQTQVFAKRVSSCLDLCSCNTGIAKHVSSCLNFCSCNTGIAKLIQMITGVNLGR